MKSLILALALALLFPVPATAAQIFGSARVRVARVNARADIAAARANGVRDQRARVFVDSFGRTVIVRLAPRQLAGPS